MSCSFGGWIKSLIKGTSTQIPRTLSRPQAGNTPGITIHEEVVGPRYRIQNFPILPFLSLGSRSFIPGKEGALEVTTPPLAAGGAAAAAALGAEEGRLTSPPAAGRVRSLTHNPGLWKIIQTRFLLLN